MGTLYLSELVWSCLQRKKADFELRGEKWPELNPYHLMSLQFATLFHDIGHGPFSHVFETFCDRYEKSEYKHEQNTARLIEKGLGEYKNIPIFLNELVLNLEENGVDKKDAHLLKPSNIANLTKGHPPTVHEYSDYIFLSQVLNFPVDIDRMDYLRRDAFHTGVETGVTDIWDILHHLTLYGDPEKKKWFLKIDADASQAVEAFLLTRDITYRKVYYNPANRSNQELLIRAFHDLVETKKYGLDELVLKDDQEAIKVFEDKGTAFCKKFVARLRSRHLYEQLPFSLNMNRDFDPTSREKRAFLWTKQFRGVVNKEYELAQALDLSPQGDTIIFDLDTAPLAEDADFGTPILWDRNENKTISLLKSLPHLELIYGEYTPPGATQPIKLGEVWREWLSNFFIYVPLELIHKTTKQIVDRARTLSDETSPGTNNLSIDIQFIQDNCQEELDSLSKIVFTLLDLIQIPQRKRETILKEFKDRMTEYLVSYVNI